MKKFWLMDEAIKRWLNTEPFDIELEDRQNEVLESLGFELYGPSYEKVMARLDQEYLKKKKLGAYSEL
jgi:hypothetical protein